MTLLRRQTVKANDPRTLESALNLAVEEAQDSAMILGNHGILVTQHSHSHYTVSLSPEVPYGQTFERREWAS